MPAVAATRAFGRHGVRVPVFGLGTAAVGGLHGPVDEDVAQATLERALTRGVRYFDTAPLYGAGLGERRLGRALAGIARNAVVLSTKVGWRVVEGGVVLDYGAEGTQRSLADSLARLGTDRIDIALVHDIDPYNHGAAFPQRLREVLDGALPALARLRAEGVVAAIGIGVNSPRVCRAVIARADIDGVVLAGRWTLLDEAAAELFPASRAAGTGVIAAAPFNSGLLAHEDGRFFHRPPPPQVAARAAALRELAARHGLPLAAPALQFPLRETAVTAVLAGARSPAQVDQLVAAFAIDVPPEFWDGLALLPPAPSAAHDITREELA